jgi:MoaA/NifB/PqqE/SkfB family radical SAM enzyme|tara:strand:+ start:202 stop:888 length:687 start_codon:yes stop_codon:yes gene_type:complete
MANWDKQKKWIDFGITTYCNAACPGCPRTDQATLQHWSWLTPTHSDTKNLLEVFKKHDYFPNLDSIRFCGERGDPMMHPDIELLIDTVCNYKYDEDHEGYLCINTNGSIRDPDFYERIAEHTNLIIIFSIDGFEETNSKYRINLDWDNIWNNLSAFCHAGGGTRGGTNACWDFLVWDHNWHEIPRVKEEAKKLGISDIEFKLPAGGNSFTKPVTDAIILERIETMINE